MPGKELNIVQDINNLRQNPNLIAQQQPLLTQNKAGLVQQPLLAGQTLQGGLLPGQQVLAQPGLVQDSKLHRAENFLEQKLHHNHTGIIPGQQGFVQGQQAFTTPSYYNCGQCNFRGNLQPGLTSYTCEKCSFVAPIQQITQVSSQIVGQRALGSQVVDQRVVETRVVDEHVTAGARVVSQELMTNQARVYEERLGSTVETEVIRKVTTPIQKTIVTPIEQKVMVPVEKTIVTNVAQTVVTPVEKTIMTQVPEKVIDQVQKVITVNETRTIVVPVQKTITVPVERTVMRNVEERVVENVSKTVVTPVTQKVITPVEQVVIKNVSQTTVTPVTQTFVSHEGGVRQEQFIQQGQYVQQTGLIGQQGFVGQQGFIGQQGLVGQQGFVGQQFVQDNSKLHRAENFLERKIHNNQTGAIPVQQGIVGQNLVGQTTTLPAQPLTQQMGNLNLDGNINPALNRNL